MRPAPLRDVARAIGATLHDARDELDARGAATDSRLVREGDLFFALRGRSDGADYAEEALRKGAVAAVASRPLAGPTLVVEDPLAALQALARWSLRRPGTGAPTVVGITGSVGGSSGRCRASATERTLSLSWSWRMPTAICRAMAGNGASTAGSAVAGHTTLSAPTRWFSLSSG